MPSIISSKNTCIVKYLKFFKFSQSFEACDTCSIVSGLAVDHVPGQSECFVSVVS